METIEYSYSGMLKKCTVRTRGIILAGRGITQHQREQDGKPFNVYALTQAAFDRVLSEHPQMVLMTD